MTGASIRSIFVGLVASLAIVAAVAKLSSATSTLDIENSALGAIPITTIKSAGPTAAPIVVVAHGFAGSQQLMLPFAVTLARNGYTAITFDFPGHGRNASPMKGGLANHAERGETLDDALNMVVMHARQMQGGAGRVALLGHSMASDIVVKYAQAHPEVDATVAVSTFSADVQPSLPRNLLVIDGALEPQALIDQGLKIIAQAGGVNAKAGVTYGRFEDGTARRLELARGVEHIAVLYSADSLEQARDWLNTAFGLQSQGFIDSRGSWIGLLYLGIVGLAFPLARLLPQVTSSAIGGSLSWRRLLIVGLVPAIATPLILWKMPTEFLPLLLGDYLVLHFALYGIITAVLFFCVRESLPTVPVPRISLKAIAIALLAATAYGTLAIAVPTDWFVASFLPIPARIPLILAMCLGTLPYFLADEWITRGASSPRGAYSVTKILFLLSLVLAIALNLQKLFFLIIIVPVILTLFVVYGLFSAWAYKTTHHPFVGAISNAIAFAWAMAVTFPLVR